MREKGRGGEEEKIIKTLRWHNTLTEHPVNI
jgi:hypothetical protein